jgi:hypothetical protein
MTVDAPPSLPRQSPPPSRPAPVRTVAGRRAWTIAGLAVAIAVVGAVVPSIVVNQFARSHQALPSTQRSFTTAVRAVTVDVDDGSVTIVPGTGRGAVVDTSGFRGTSVPTDDERMTGHTLVVRSSCAGPVTNWCQRNYVLHLPRPASAAVVVSTGPIAVTGIDGRLALGANDGDIAVTGGNGPLHATSGTGSVTVDDVHGSVDLRTSDGDIAVTGASGPLRATTGAGSVTAIGLAGPSVTARTGDGDVDLGFTASPDDVTATSGTGSVTVGLPAGSGPYQVHATSSTGRVTTTVAADPTSRRTVLATTSDGDVTVRYGPG